MKKDTCGALRQAPASSWPIDINRRLNLWK